MDKHCWGSIYSEQVLVVSGVPRGVGMRSLPRFAYRSEGCLQTSLTSYFSSQFISSYVVFEAFTVGNTLCAVYKKCQWNLSTFTHIKLWKDSGIIDKRRIKLYTGLYRSSQVARKSSSPLPAPAIFQNIEIRLESARAHAASFYSVN